MPILYGKELNPGTSVVCEAADIFFRFRPMLWEYREALLNLLQGLKQRHREPDTTVLARLLRAYGQMAVRDTHWFHICGRLSRPSPIFSQGLIQDSIPNSDQCQENEIPPTLILFPESALSDTLLGLARLNLPQLAESASLFTRIPDIVRSPGPA